MTKARVVRAIDVKQDDLKPKIKPKRSLACANDECPVCDTPLPANPSTHLQYLLSTRGDGDHDVIAEQSICRRHRAESALVIAIRNNECPASIDFDMLPFRLRSFLSHILRLSHGDDRSPFLEAAADRHRRGLPLRQKQNGLFGQMLTIGDTLSGYYGEKGQDITTSVILNQIEVTGLISRSMTAPFYSIPDFVRHVLVPEAAIFLIRQDHPWMGWREANERRRASAEWGLVLGGMDEEVDDGHDEDVQSSSSQEPDQKLRKVDSDDSDDLP